jgi:soluble lytic murein transglycosylase-like protein
MRLCAALATVAGLAFSIQCGAAPVKKTSARRGAELPLTARYYADVCADHWSVPRELVRVMMFHESGGNPNAVSHINKEKSRNGQGLMQLLPSTAKTYGVDDPFSPGSNACGGAHYLSDLIHEFGDYREAIAAYYCGQRHIERRGLKYSNPEVVAYVRTIHALYVQELKKEGLYDEAVSR